MEDTKTELAITLGDGMYRMEPKLNEQNISTQ